MMKKAFSEGDTTQEFTKPLVLHNLPNADYGQFIGRETEIGRIHDILRPYPYSQHSIVTIDGIGGIGKSTLAMEATHYYLRNYNQLLPSERFDAYYPGLVLKKRF